MTPGRPGRTMGSFILFSPGDIDTAVNCADWAVSVKQDTISLESIVDEFSLW